MSKTMTNGQLRVLKEALEAIEDYYLIDGTYDEAVDYGDCLPDTTKEGIKNIVDYETMKAKEATA
tara:strand:+ start:640 stop:834 length:195 start_codon:yes stop_codon:yes gene_type:complete